MTKTRPFLWVSAALLFAVAVAWISADDDDRPPIIVTNGSMYFTNGDASSPITPTQWTDDIVLSEWKPADNGYHGISGFAVSFENSYAPTICPDASTTPPSVFLSADEVKIEYTQGAGKGKITSTIRRRRSHLLGVFGKFEPKVGNPHGTSQKLQMPSSTQLEFEDLTADGYISQVTVGQTVCAFPAPPDATSRLAFRVRIQPKKEQ